ncbi:MAG: hypothetical protein ACI4PM_05110 [Butyricicoccus sp.]
MNKKWRSVVLTGILAAGLLCGCGESAPDVNEKAQDPHATMEETILGKWNDRITGETIGMREDGTFRGNKKSQGEYAILDDQTIRLAKTEISFWVKGDFMCFYNEGRDVTPPDYCVRQNPTKVTQEDITGVWTAYADPDYTIVDGTVTFYDDGTSEVDNDKMVSGDYSFVYDEDGNNMLYFKSDTVEDYETELVAAAGDLVWIDPAGKEIYFLVRTGDAEFKMDSES